MRRSPSLVKETRIGIGTVRRLPGQSLAGRARLVALAAAVPAVSRFSPGRSVPITVQLGTATMRFPVTHLSDLLVLSEVLFGTQYERPALDRPQTIIDAGAHIGASVAYFAHRYPDARIVGIEASPSTFKRLTASVGHLPNVELLNVALGGQDGTISFFERAAAWESSATTTSPGEAAVEVQMLSLKTLLATIGAEHVDLLKMDIEGAEWPALRDYPELAEHVGAIVAELHTWLPGVDYTDADIFGLLGAYDVEDDTSGSDRMIRAVRTNRVS